MDTNPAVTISVRVPPEIRDQLERLADATGRTKSFLASEAIESYLQTHAWQIHAIQEAVKKIDDNKGQFVDQRDVLDWVNTWDSTDEKDLPR